MGFTSEAKAGFRRVDATTITPPYFTLSEDRSAQRISIDRAGALLSNAYLAAEQAKARALGGLPVHTFRDGDKGREKAKNHALTKLVARRWNPLMTAQTGWQWVSVRRDTFGGAYVRVVWHAGEPVEFWPINVPVETFYDATAPVSPVRYSVQPGDKFTPAGNYFPNEILYFPTCISTDGGVTGRSLAELAAAEIGLDINLTRFYSSIIARGFNPGGWLEHPDELTEPDVAAIAAKNRMLSGPDHAGELRIFDKGLKYHTVGQTMAEADIVKQEEFVLQSVARAVYVQPNKVFDFSRATYSNIEAAGIAFVTDTMMNEVTAIESEVNKLLDFMGQLDHYIKFDLRGLQRGDFKSQMEGWVAGIYGGAIKRSEVREWMDLPFEEGSDELLQPAAYYAIDPTTGEAKPAPKPTGSQASVFGPVLADARDRIKGRMANGGSAEKMHSYARKVLEPIAAAHAEAGIAFDIDNEIREALDA